jgi:hypothetical protein
MRRLSSAFLGLVTTMSSAWAADPAAVVREAWTTTVASEARFYAWRSDRGSPSTVVTAPGSGSQWYIPLAAQVAGRPSEDFKVQFLARGGWLRSEQSTAGLSGSVSTFTDTVTTGTVTYLGIDGIQPFVSLNLNLPTGRSALFGSAANARMDPDLVEVGSFGEGWNIGPTIGFNRPITPSLMFTGSVGYTWRGPFNRERSSAQPDPNVQVPTKLNPGDVITGTASIGYQGSPWAWSLTGTISEESTTTENGADLYRAGRRYLGTATVSYTWPEQWGQTTVNASAAHSNRNKVLFVSASSLITETLNTNSDLYRAGVQHLFLVTPNLALGPTGSFLYSTHNSYDPTTFQFVPAKDRWAAGGLARVAANQDVTLNFRGEYVWVHEDERLGGQQFSVLLGQLVNGSAVPVVSSTGWMVAGGANVKF